MTLERSFLPLGALRVAVLLPATVLADAAFAQRLERSVIADFAAVGDLDLDGSDDVVVRTTSEAYAVSGRTGRRMFAIDGPLAWSTREWDQRATIAALGDVDGDARPDFALAWMPYTNHGVPLVRVHSGHGGEVLAEFSLDGAGARPEVTVAAAGDLDRDGRCDLLIGEPWHDRERGRVRAISSATWKDLWSVDGGVELQLLGGACASLGDQDGDGRAEVAISAPSFRRQVQNLGLRVSAVPEIVVVSGIDGSIHRRIRPADLRLTDQGLLGRALVTCADIDGDSKRDLLASWTFEGWISDHEPRVLAISSVRAAPIITYRGVEETFDMFGQSLANVGDIDGDGADDMLIGDPEANVSFDLNADYPDIGDSGRVKVYSGRDGRVLRTWRGQDHYGMFGAFVCRAGDLNGDRVPDLWIAELSPARLHAFSSKDGSYLRRIDLETLESPQALGPLGR